MLARSSSTPRRLIVMYFPHPFHLLLHRLWRVWLIIGVGVAIGDVAQGHQVTGAGREELRASSLARGSRRHESVAAREAQSAIRHFRRPPLPSPPLQLKTSANYCTRGVACQHL